MRTRYALAVCLLAGIAAAAAAEQKAYPKPAKLLAPFGDPASRRRQSIPASQAAGAVRRPGVAVKMIDPGRPSCRRRSAPGVAVKMIDPGRPSCRRRSAPGVAVKMIDPGRLNCRRRSATWCRGGNNRSRPA
jgi:hypothetical protein